MAENGGRKRETDRKSEVGHKSQADRKRENARSFDRAASSYFDSAVHRDGDGDDLQTLADWCADADRALDVATGAGHTAGAVADAGVSDVVAADIAPEMVTIATREYDLAGVVADAERLPFADDAFDAVTCRIAAHHFPDPEAFVSEVARVLDPGGVFAFEDNVAPEDVDLAAFLDEIERIRDPAHVSLYPESRWHEWFEDAGLSVEESAATKMRLEYDPWVDRTDVPADERVELVRRFRNASAEARDLYEIELDDDGVRAFSNLKVLIRAGA
ncbi:class I SAM-dependent methyltransferase [Haloprofundus salilacus]|uniref:class I SAM-dependent methyltransferase n=1 Tax=Haloprofundus salilacus TaxID=2876190 RepID=UPI001CC8F6FC|nr:class I SAM-dependent methyltransferase [Haloprofundus salilacus]